MSTEPDSIQWSHFPTWVWEPNRMFRYRGFATADIWISPGRIVVVTRRLPLGARPLRLQQLEYTWPTAVVQFLKPNYWTATLLLDMGGQLGSASVRGRHRLPDALSTAGFNVIESVRRWEPYRSRIRNGWERPRAVPMALLGARLNEVPPCVVMQ